MINLRRGMRGAFALAVAFTATSASATFTQVRYAGFVESGFDTSGEFGLPGTNLAGLAFSFIANFEDTRGDIFREPGVHAINIGESGNSPGRGQIRINDRSFTAGDTRSFQSAAFGTSLSHHLFSQLDTSLGDNHLKYAYSIDLAVVAETPIFAIDYRAPLSLAIPGFGSFFMQYLLETPGGVRLIDRKAQGRLAVTSVSVVSFPPPPPPVEVPEPPAVLPLLLGAGLLARSRARRVLA